MVFEEPPFILPFLLILGLLFPCGEVGDFEDPLLTPKPDTEAVDEDLLPKGLIGSVLGLLEDVGEFVALLAGDILFQRCPKSVERYKFVSQNEDLVNDYELEINYLCLS